jgi:hypothetical protein
MIIRLFNEEKAISEVKSDTETLIHYSSSVPAIKLLVSSWEILDLSEIIAKEYKDYPVTPWNPDSLGELDGKARQLQIYHLEAFKPPKKVLDWASKVRYLIFNLARK